MDKPRIATPARLSALVAVVVAALALSACTSSSSSKGTPTVTKTVSGSSSSAPSSKVSTPTTAPSTPAGPTTPVHVEGYPDGRTVGVGMPIIATFNKKITSALNFVKDTSVTVNGAPVQGGWYFENSDPVNGYVMEAHYRLQNYWPAHAHIHVTFNLKGVSAGPGLSFDGALTSLDFNTGPANIVTVNDATHELTVTSDGRPWGSPMPVSLGASNTPTANGTKVIMEKGVSICMSGPGYDECGIKYTQRLTYGGEYLHAAPWNTYNITHGIDSSNGCTNLYTSDAEKLYGFLEIGDVVLYPNANGPKMQMGSGYGDWNVNWGEWQTGGALSTTA